MRTTTTAIAGPSLTTGIAEESERIPSSNTLSQTAGGQTQATNYPRHSSDQPIGGFAWYFAKRRGRAGGTVVDM
jgi:hypothetical protein